MNHLDPLGRSMRTLMPIIVETGTAVRRFTRPPIGPLECQCRSTAPP